MTLLSQRDEPPCHSLPQAQWCDRDGPGGFMGHTCHKPPAVLLTHDDLLVLLAEECGEVIQAGTKCLRFGWGRHQPGYGVNKEVLAREVGDLLGVIDALGLDYSIVNKFRSEKIAKATRVKNEIRSIDGELTRERTSDEGGLGKFTVHEWPENGEGW